MPITAKSLSTPIGSVYVSSNGRAITSLDFKKPDGFLPKRTKDPLLNLAVMELDEYFSGFRTSFSVPFEQSGTVFQEKIWQEIISIPFGSLLSYKQLAEKLKTQGYRAVGSSCGKNSIPIFIPCHRVIASRPEASGKEIPLRFLGGYSGHASQSQGIKRTLLEWEGFSVVDDPKT